MPFRNAAGTGPARVVLEQVDDVQFRVCEAFRYVDDHTGKTYDVPAGDPTDPTDVTDLASVPWMLRWLVTTYGQHTTAALVHDRLVRPDNTLGERVEADTVFFRAMEEGGNNWMRHRLMWAGVALGTMWRFRKILTVVFLVHVVAFWVALLWAVGLPAWIQREAGIDWLPFEQGELEALLAATALFMLGFAWHFTPTADRSLSWWLWLAAAVGVGLITPPSLLIRASVYVVQLVDYFAAALRSLGPQQFRRPSPVKPPEAPKAEPEVPPMAPAGGSTA